MSDPEDLTDVNEHRKKRGPPLPMMSESPSFLRALDHCLLHLRDLQIPDFTGEPVVQVFSDYAGPDEGATIQAPNVPKFRTYSFMFTAGEIEIRRYREEMREIRRRYGMIADMRVEYKNIHNSVELRSALPDIANAIHRLNGLIFTLVVDSSIATIFGDAEENHRRARAAGLGPIKQAPLERALRVSCSLAYWLAMLVGKEQQALWLGDRDSIWANDNVKGATNIVLTRALEWVMYPGKRLGRTALFYIEKCPKLATGDLLSIPDLVAGTLARYMSDIREQNPREKVGLETLLGLVSPRPQSRLHNVIYEATDSRGVGRLHTLLPLIGGT
jgi:hypothetical protein